MELIDLLGDIGKLAGVADLLREVNPPAPGGWITTRAGKKVQLKITRKQPKLQKVALPRNKIPTRRAYKSKVFKTKALAKNKNPNYKYARQSASKRIVKRDILWSKILAARTATLKKRQEARSEFPDLIQETWITKNGNRIFIGNRSFDANDPQWLDTEKKVLTGELKAWQNMGGAVIDRVQRSAMKENVHDPIVEAIRKETIKEPVYRGLRMVNDSKEIVYWKEGQDVQIPPASWTKSQDVAETFAGRAKGITGKAYVLTVAGPDTHGLDIGSRGSPLYMSEHEVITGGKFHIESIAPPDKYGISHISLKQTGVF
jgi:hypothetical protein